MSNVVFTGRCNALRLGRFLTRPALTRIAGAAGFTVVPTISSRVRFLVSSRVDTRKARAARDWGIETITYERFLELCAVQEEAVDVDTPITRFNVPLPQYDAGRMAPEDAIAATASARATAKMKVMSDPNNSPHQRQTAIGGKRLRRALDLG